MAKEFNWGIIGPGRIAHKFAAAVEGIPNSRIYAIASKTSKDLEKLKREYSATRAFSSYEELASDSTVDAVYISTPHNFHYENARLCLENMKPALVEKPFTVTADQAQLLLDLARNSQIYIMEAMWTRFLPIYSVVSRWLDEKKIGEVQLVRSTLGFIANRENKDRLLNPSLAGGATLDLGTYTTAASQFAFRRQPEHISAMGFFGETGVDEAICVSLDYGRGRFSQFSCSFISRLPGELEIIGSNGSIRVGPVFNRAEKAILVTRVKSKTVLKPHRKNGFEYQIEESQKQIKAGQIDSPKHTHQQILENMKVLDKVRELVCVRYKGID